MGVCALPKKMTHVHENTYVGHDAKVREKNNFLVETIGPTRKKPVEVYAS